MPKKTGGRDHTAVTPEFKERPFEDFPTGLSREGVAREFSRRLIDRMRQLALNQSDVGRIAAKYDPTGTFGRDLISNYCKPNGKGKLPSSGKMGALAKALRMDPHNLLPSSYPTRSVAQDNLPKNAMDNQADGSTMLKLSMRLPTAVALQIMTLAIENDLDKKKV